MNDGDTINDDEFEALLDELHGSGKAPGADAERGETTAASALPAALTIREVGELGELLQARLTNDVPIRMDLSVVENIDTAGIQLLMAFQRTADATGLACEWANPSVAVSRIVDLLGVTSMRFSQTGHS